MQIIDFNENYSKDFARLNMAWLQKYFVAEPIDEKILSNPVECIINKGGFIFFATLQNAIVGTFALMKIEDGVFELSKMAVAEEFQGKKIGNKMIEYCLQKAKELSAHKVILYSNTILTPAIHLYEKYGFKEVALDKTEYKRANIKMEIDIK